MIDSQKIFASKSIPIPPDVYMPELYKELAKQGADLLLNVVQGYPETFANPLKQNEKEASYGKFLLNQIILTKFLIKQ